MRVRVTGRTQVNLEGRVYGPGEELEAPEELAERWIASGWAERLEAKARPPAPNKARSSKAATKRSSGTLFRHRGISTLA